MEHAQAYDPDQLLTQDEAAQILAVQSDTLAHWRARKQGPSFCKLGRMVRYRRQDLTSYVEGRLCGGTIEARKHNRA